MKILVGSTGLVGSNLAKTMNFDLLVHSSDVELAYGKKPKVLFYAGVPGTKFIANAHPDMDKKIIEQAKYNIRMINPQKIVLISTVDVYDDLNNKDEDYQIKMEKLHDYGRNRYDLEQWVSKNFVECHILRLPALYGEGLKKNFIHDLIYPCPPFLTKEIFQRESKKFKELEGFYKYNNGMFQLMKVNKSLFEYFENNNFNAVHFTDINSVYQYFNLNQLDWIISIVIKNNIKILNCVTPPILSKTLYEQLFKKEFINMFPHVPISYNLKTKYGKTVFGIKDYICSYEDEISILIDFIEKERCKYAEISNCS